MAVELRLWEVCLSIHALQDPPRDAVRARWPARGSSDTPAQEVICRLYRNIILSSERACLPVCLRLATAPFARATAG
jgi:hypothetical protein